MKISGISVELIDSMGDDISVVNAARVSFAKESEYVQTWRACAEEPELSLSEKDQKLIQYLAKHGHWTPFGHAFLSFRIKAPIFVARQMVKHQVGLVWNEVSRRYVDYEPEFWFPSVWRGKPVNAKQGSSDIVMPDPDRICATWPELVLRYASECYRDMIKAGYAPEQARMVLPLNTMTEWIWSGSLMAFARVCKLRLDPHSQQETREVAEKMQALVPDTFKYSWSALLQN